MTDRDDDLPVGWTYWPDVNGNTTALSAALYDADMILDRPTAPKRKKTKKPNKNAKRRQKVFKRDGYRCVDCGSGAKLTLDHIIPKSKGGTNALFNLQTLCAPCNEKKADTLGLRERAARRRIAHLPSR